MSVLTESMARLRAEILAARHGREVFRQELAQATRARQIRVFDFRSAFAQDLAGARRAWQERALTGPPPAQGPAPLPLPTASSAVTGPKNKRKRRLKH